ncbi:hypothetical protein IEQ34_020236 [Dendrobium chrysotoxum]|uniref:CBS domain-containing protein n=1 Tax=Dendrobium chrysotoxum TaxID=161865 RepID=A0AAV7G0D2_DENCH|nr:hypothetical protein IEQ34_020236 [Dendrobium chrysotoxum]
MDLSSISKILNDSTDGHKKEGIVLSPTSQFEDASCVCSSSSWDSMASGSALQSFLDHISIDPITNFLNTSVLELKHDDCIQDAIRSLYERNVFGAPIVNSVSSDRGNFIDRDIGFIEFSSMVLWSLEEFDKASAESKSDSHGFLSMLEQISEIGQTKVGELAKFFLWEPFFPASPGDSLLRVLLLFSKHRRLKVVPVVESSNSCVVSFITQNAVLQLLLQSSGLDWFDQIADMPISDFGFEKNRALVCIFGDQTVADALHILWENHSDAVPVIGRVTKTLIGFVRSSDIYLLLEDDELYENRKSFKVGDFIKSYTRRTIQDSNSSINEESSTLVSSAPLLLKNNLLPPMDTPTTNLSSDSLKQVMQDMLESKSECSFLVTESGQLQSVITLRDIMSKFSPPSMDATIDGGGFFQSALEQSGCHVEDGVMVRDKH